VRADPTFRLAPDEWYVQQRVTVLTSTTVTAVDTATRTVTVELIGGKSTSILPYDRLVLATGGNNFVPVANLPHGNVFGMRTATDVDGITAFLARHPGGPSSARVLLIGGGLAALEAAAALCKLGVTKISMVEMVPRILPRQLSEEASRVYQAALTRAGIKLYLGTTCGTFVHSGDTVSGIMLCSGEHIDLDLLCFSIGTVPEVALAKAIGCKTNRGILVNERMETSVQDVWACGDCTEFAGRNIPNWTEATGQGRAAGLQVVGAAVPDSQFVRQASPYFLDAFCNVFSVGQVDGCATKASFRGTGDSLLELFFAKDKTLAGAIVLGDFVRTLQTPITLAVNQHVPFLDAMEFITAVSS
jgi:NAD(P)H-nitrite reductase large subunit